MAPTTPPEAAALSTLFVQIKQASVKYAFGDQSDANWRAFCSLLSDAQAALDTLALEVGRLTGELAEASQLALRNANAVIEALKEQDALKAALPDAEAVMRLASEFASAHYLFERFGGQGYGDVRDTAREALRSAINPSGVGE